METLGNMILTTSSWEGANHAPGSGKYYLDHLRTMNSFDGKIYL